MITGVKVISYNVRFVALGVLDFPSVIKHDWQWTKLHHLHGNFPIKTSKTSIFSCFFGPLKLPFSRGKLPLNPPFISDFPSKSSNLSLFVSFNPPFIRECSLFPLPSGKLTVHYEKSPFCSWVNPLFLWPFSSSQTVSLPGRVVHP